MARDRSEYVKSHERVRLTPGEVIKMTCELKEISRAELSRRSGISEAHLSEMIRGVRKIGLKIAEKLSDALGVSPAFILFHEQQTHDGVVNTSFARTGIRKIIRDICAAARSERPMDSVYDEYEPKITTFVLKLNEAASHSCRAPMKLVAHKNKKSRVSSSTCCRKKTK